MSSRVKSLADKMARDTYANFGPNESMVEAKPGTANVDRMDKMNGITATALGNRS